MLSALFITGCGAQILDESGGAPNGGDEGKGDGDGSGGGPDALEAGSFLVELGVVQCDHAFVCRAEFPEDLFGVPFEEAVGNVPEDCYDDANDLFMPAQVQASVDAGRIVYSAAAAASCLEGVSFPETCPEYWQVGPSLPQICSATLIPTVAPGGACTIDFDCVGDTFCDATSRTCTQAAFAPDRDARFRAVSP
jgi:hypothetical protein